MDVKPRELRFSVFAEHAKALSEVRRVLSTNEYFKGRANDARRVVEVGPSRNEAGKYKQEFTLKFQEGR